MRLGILTAMTLVSCAAFAQTNPAQNGGDQHWHAQSWDDAVQTLPCSAFQRKPGGQWTMPGKIDLPNNAVISNMTFGPDNASKALDGRCGTGQ